MGSVVKAKVEESDKITREGRSMVIRKEVVGFLQIVVGKNNLLLQFEYGEMKEISSSLILFLSLKEEVDMDEPI